MKPMMTMVSTSLIHETFQVYVIGSGKIGYCFIVVSRSILNIADCEGMKATVLRNAEDAYNMNKARTSLFDRTVQSPTKEKSKCAILVVILCSCYNLTIIFLSGILFLFLKRNYTCVVVMFATVP